MEYGGELEKQLWRELLEWRRQRILREFEEDHLAPDERLDDVGWEIFYYAIDSGATSAEAARQAMHGTYRLRRLVRDDLNERHFRHLLHRWGEYGWRPVYGYDRSDAAAQLNYWRDQDLTNPSYVYFIQDGRKGAVKIGMTVDPEKRLRDLQTGNPRTLRIRHVIPGDRSTEKALHARFEPARIRGEWFGREYLPIILAFASGISEEMIHTYERSGDTPVLAQQGARVRTHREVLRIRKDLERLWLTFGTVSALVSFTGLEEEEVRDHLQHMAHSTLYPDIRRAVARLAA